VIVPLRVRPAACGGILLSLCVLLLSGRGDLAAQSEGPSNTTALEVLAERATRAVVLIDVQTPSSSRQGSGFLVESDGLILTNHHVVRDARSARVKLANGDVYDQVVLLAEDERRDIAVLRIAGFDLPTLPLGNSDSVRIGSPVVLIGSPLGLANTVSTGIVSGRRQEPQGFQLLQITAPASQGSSGGAVLSANGDVIGIAVSQLLAGQNLNFAVPINYARGMLRNLDTAAPVTLRPVSTAVAPEEAARPIATTEVNSGLSFDVEGFLGYGVAWTADADDGRQRHTRITYRVIETLGGDPPRIERYLDSETTVRMEPFGTRQIIRRERSRAIVEARGLRPLSSRGEVAWWTDQGWERAGHDVRFEGDKVLGLITDSTGRVLDLDRPVPTGVLLRDMGDLAFAMLEADSLLGRSVEFFSFDPRTAELTQDRYDVVGIDTIQVGGTSRSVLRVSLAAGLSNETIYFDRGRPRVAVRRVGDDGGLVEEVVCLDIPSGSREAGVSAAPVSRTAWCLQPPDQ